MIPLRQGKPKSILDNSINSAITAVEIYNRPKTEFRIENYVVLMVIAWTKLFHSYFQVTIGERYFYKEKNKRYKRIDGEKKAWELRECIKNYQKFPHNGKMLAEPVVANLNFFIQLRNKIEHRHWDSSALDILLFGECQSLLYNYENLLTDLYGDEYSLNTCLSYALQFSHLRAKEQLLSQRKLLSKEMQDIKRFVEKYKSDLSQEVFDSQEYSVKLIQIPKVSNTNRADLAVEFVNWNSLNEEDRQNYEKLNAIIKDKKINIPVSNLNMLRPSGVIAKIEKDIGIKLNHSCLIAFWKAFGIRPDSKAESKFETNEKYCVYDEPHDDYLYTQEWVAFLETLLTKHGFNKENIKDKCKTMLKIDDYV